MTDSKAVSKVTATMATVFISTSISEDNKAKLVEDYQCTYHNKRPADPTITDKFIFLTFGQLLQAQDNLNDVINLLKHTDLSAVNFIILEDAYNQIADSSKVVVDKVVLHYLIEWDSLFRKNAFNGSTTRSITVQNFSAVLKKSFEVRDVKRLPIGLKY